MKYKMVAIDMDGTLLNSDKEVTKRTKEVLIEAQLKGVKIIITTGRIFTSAQIYSEYIGLKTAIIACNGAIIKGVGNEKHFTTFPINKKIIIQAATICEEVDIPYYFYSKNKIYTTKHMDFNKLYNKKETQIDYSYTIPVCNLKNISLVDTIDEEILKINIWDSNEEKVRVTLAKVHQIKNTFVTSSSLRNIELTDIEATKGNAIKTLAEYYNIGREEIIAIGDSDNDQSMIEYAGLGVAMENAKEEVKERADFVTLSNDQEGVLKVFEKFVL